MIEPINYQTLNFGDKFYSSFHLTEKLIKDFSGIFDENFINISKKSKVPKYVFAVYRPIHQAIGALPQGTIHIQQKMEHFSDAYIGDVLEVVVTVKNKINKGKKRILKFEVDFICEDRLICRHETTHLLEFTNGGF